MGTPLETLRDLIRVPSVSGNEAPVQAHIQNFFAEEGIEAFYQADNIVVHLEGIDRSKAFVFNSHVDVVHEGDRSKWQHDPWGGEVVDGRIYGRGASDMKSGAAATMELAKKFALRENLPCDVWFTYVVREEIDGEGTASFAKWFEEQGFRKGYADVAVIFTEPTNLNLLQYGHRGNYFIEANIDGDAGHASMPSKIQRHAIREMTGLISDLEEESEVWKKEHGGSEFAPPTITPTSFEAISQSSNKVADHARAVFDLRTIPSFHMKAYERVVELAKARGIEISLVSGESPSGYTDPNSRIVKTLQELMPDIELGVSQASADLGFMTSLDVEGIIFGPGDLDQMHITDESAPVEHLDRAIELYDMAVYAWSAS